MEKQRYGKPRPELLEAVREACYKPGMTTCLRCGKKMMSKCVRRFRSCPSCTAYAERGTDPAIRTVSTSQVARTSLKKVGAI